MKLTGGLAGRSFELGGDAAAIAWAWAPPICQPPDGTADAVVAGLGWAAGSCEEAAR